MSVLEAAKQHNILIPHFCYLENVHQVGACRICVVEIEGKPTLQASCMVPAQEGMVVWTNTARVRKARRLLYELMLSDHPRDCLSCYRNQNCEFQKLGELIHIPESRFGGERSKTEIDRSNPSIVRDTSKCILCRRCVTVCNEVQGVGVINVQGRGFRSRVSPADDLPLNAVNCTYCGQCLNVCPTAALMTQDETGRVWRALHDPSKRVIVQTAPAVRVALGEEFGYPAGTRVTGKMVSALREAGFDDVFDTNFAADLTIMEEGHEFLARATAALTGSNGNGHAGPLPMITSCSPGWIKYIEHEYARFLPHLSTCRSPHMMLGALAKTFYADKLGVDPADIYVVSVMPCTAKKFEITRPEMFIEGRPSVDAVLTTRELARLIRDAGIPFRHLPDSPFDEPLGYSTGAADIFGATGGVMEAALRTVYEVVTGRPVPFEHLDIHAVRGLTRVKQASLTITNPRPAYSHLDGFTVRVAVTSGLAGAYELMDQIERGESPYHFIEVMGCPGGCISGGGQPRPTTRAIREARMRAIYEEDAGKPKRKSHENPFVVRLYEDFFGEPLGHRSHELLHTHYTPRGRYNELLEREEAEVLVR
jgi:NADH-quinone oxidoreductase subunit G/NADP-reducing hydrogenase subunit HndD